MSSDLSSDEEFILLDSIHPKLKTRRIGVHEINKKRQELGEYHHLFQQLKEHPDRFYSYMRMSLDTFQYILTKIKHSLEKCWSSWHRPILPEERLVVTLRYLAAGSSFKTLAFSFRMGASTIASIVDETVNVLWQELQPQHLPVPNVASFITIAEDFMEKWNFPNCIGALDGKHVRVKCPHNSGSMFFNYKKFFSIVLQAVVDARYKFIVVDVGGYGKQSDGGTFHASDLYRALIKKRLQLPEPSALPHSNVVAPFVFLADEAYPLLPYLMRPFSGTNLLPDLDNFNKRLSRARKTVECAFGILTSKWTILGKGIETRPELSDSIIKCVCALHNTIIDKEGMPQNPTDVSMTMPTTVWEHVGRPTNDARDIRELFSSYFAHHPVVYDT